MAFVVVYDACVLFPAPLRDLLLRLAADADWSARLRGRVRTRKPRR